MTAEVEIEITQPVRIRVLATLGDDGRADIAEIVDITELYSAISEAGLERFDAAVRAAMPKPPKPVHVSGERHGHDPIGWSMGCDDCGDDGVETTLVMVDGRTWRVCESCIPATPET